MKFKTTFTLILFALLFCVVACGGEEAKRPIDYPNTQWTCEDAGISFSVSKEGKVENAAVLNKNKEAVNVTLVFSDIGEKKVSFYSEDGKELYFSGSCTYGKDTFTVTVSDIYNSDFSGFSPRLIFKRK